MERCMHCGKEGDLPIRALEVRTLPIRDLTGERRVQALGDWKDAAVCRSCAEEERKREENVLRSACPRLWRFGLVLAAGALLEALSFLVLNRERVYVLLGLAAVACGLIGMVSSVREAAERKRELARLSGEEALEEAAWALFVQHMPKKEGDNDLTYIPVNARTRRRKNGDLMVLYHLLPAIANEAYARIRQDAEQTAPGQPPADSSTGP